MYVGNCDLWQLRIESNTVKPKWKQHRRCISLPVALQSRNEICSRIDTSGTLFVFSFCEKLPATWLPSSMGILSHRFWHRGLPVARHVPPKSQFEYFRAPMSAATRAPSFYFLYSLLLALPVRGGRCATRWKQWRPHINWFHLFCVVFWKRLWILISLSKSERTPPRNELSTANGVRFGPRAQHCIKITFYSVIAQFDLKLYPVRDGQRTFHAKNDRNYKLKQFVISWTFLSCCVLLWQLSQDPSPREIQEPNSMKRTLILTTTW